MIFARLSCAACVCVFFTFAFQLKQDPKENPENKGSIEGQNTYRSPALGLTISLPGEWYFFDRWSYASPEQKQKEKEMEEQARATCTGPLCGHADIDVALRSPAGPMPPVYTISIGGHKLSAEYQDRVRHPLKEFARIMSLGSLGGNWIPDGELTAIQLGGRPAYRLVIHNAHVTTAKGFLYVADSNGQVFMLLGTAMSDSERLQSAVEKLAFTNPAQLGEAGSLPNTAGALHTFLTDLLTATKDDDQSKLWSKIADLEIPDYENWFIRTYGQDKGQFLATEYGKYLKADEQRFYMLCRELAKQEGEISISRFDAANRKFPGVSADATLSDPTEAFKADWKKTDTSAGPSSQAIGFFSFVDGKFRVRRFAFNEERVLSPVKPGPVLPAKLIDRVQPVYPEAARQLRVHGMVSLNVVIHKDGTVTVQDVGDGHPLLAPPAVAAVQQWKYQPTTVGGEPVDVEAKVYVTFELGEQKK